MSDQAIAKDGDLGDLGKEQLGEAASGVSPANLIALTSAVAKFQAELISFDAANADANQAAALMNGWVALGNKVADLVLPMIQKAVTDHANKPDAPHVPGFVTALQQMAGIGSSFASLLQGLPGVPQLPFLQPVGRTA